MNRRSFIILLLVAAIASIAYAIYRSVEQKVILLGDTQQQVYGEPQHGLLLGLCVFASACLMGAVKLMNRADLADTHVKEVEKPASTTVTRRIL